MTEIALASHDQSQECGVKEKDEKMFADQLLWLANHFRHTYGGFPTSQLLFVWKNIEYAIMERNISWTIYSSSWR